jgi:hypothetical protein
MRSLGIGLIANLATVVDPQCDDAAVIGAARGALLQRS